MRIKICCISSVAEMELAVSCGASAIGLVSAMPSGPGVIDEALIAEIARATPANIETFLLTSLTSASEIVAQHRRCGTTAIQLTDWVEPDEYVVLRAELPAVKFVQVVHVIDYLSVAEAELAASMADEILLDSGRPDAEVKTLGGTGQPHNWELSKAIVELVKVPVWLAGGLNPENVGDAIRQVGPGGVDLCSGVRTGGVLGEKRLRAFVNAVNSAMH